MIQPSQVIFRITPENMKILPYFKQFVNYINQIYLQLDSFSTLEIIEGGFYGFFEVWVTFYNLYRLFVIFAAIFYLNGQNPSLNNSQI